MQTVAIRIIPLKWMTTSAHGITAQDNIMPQSITRMTSRWTASRRIFTQRIERLVQ